MKTVFKVLFIGLMGSCSSVFSAPQSDSVSATVGVNASGSATVQIQSVADFEQPLSKLGTWIDFGNQGRAWHPREIGSTWRPFCNGNWVWSDAGWFWASTEPWAWACYHYGSWISDPRQGWVWFPATEWSPAWVNWRVGTRYIGWAPFSPSGEGTASGGSTGDFVFIDTQRFTQPLKVSVVLTGGVNLINETKPVSGGRREMRRDSDGRSREIRFNEGPGVDIVQQATGQQITAVPVQQLAQQTATPGMKTGAAAGSPSSPTPGSVTIPGRTQNLTPTGQPGGQSLRTQTNQPAQPTPTNGAVMPPGTGVPQPGLTNQPPHISPNPNFPTNGNQPPIGGNLPPTGRPSPGLPTNSLPSSPELPPSPTLPPAPTLPPSRTLPSPPTNGVPAPVPRGTNGF